MVSKTNFYNQDIVKNRSNQLSTIILKTWEIVRKNYKPEKVATGQFGADMKVELENDGPVTIEICNDDKKAKREKPEKSEN